MELIRYIGDNSGTFDNTGNWVRSVINGMGGVIGSGVLSMAWAVAQLGWIACIGSVILFSLISLFTSYLLSDCYRCPQTGKRNYSYMDAVKSNLACKNSGSALGVIIL